MLCCYRSFATLANYRNQAKLNTKISLFERQELFSSVVLTSTFQVFRYIIKLSRIRIFLNPQPFRCLRSTRIRWIRSMHSRGKDWIRYRDVSVFKNIWIRPSTRGRIHSMFKKIHSGERIQKVADKFRHNTVKVVCRSTRRPLTNLTMLMQFVINKRTDV